MRLISAVTAILVACIPSAFALPTKHDTSNEEVTEEGRPPVRSLDETLQNVIDTLVVEADGSVSSSKKLKTFKVVNEINDELTDSATDITKKDKTTKAQEKLSKGTKQSKTGNKMPKSSSKCTKFKGMIKTPKMPKGTTYTPRERAYTFMRVSLKGSNDCSEIQSFFEDSLCMDFNLLECRSVSASIEESSSETSQVFDAALGSLKSWSLLLQIFDVAADSLSEKEKKKYERNLEKLWKKRQDSAIDTPLSIEDIFSKMIPSMQPSNFPSTSPSSLQSFQPSNTPSKVPSDIPSDIPSKKPSDVPSDQPSSLPSSMPSDIPSLLPSNAPSKVPSDIPSDVPSKNLSKVPSDQPSSLPSLMPSDIPSDSPSEQLPLLQFSTSFAHACALYSTEVKCIGTSSSGERGLEPGTGNLNFANTLSVSSSSSTIKKVVMGAYFTCMLVKDGSVYCNGWNYYGQLGDGTTNTYSNPSPVQVKKDGNDALTGVTDLSEAYNHICAIYGIDDKIYCWGYNDDGQLGWNGTPGVKTVVATEYSTCLVKESNPRQVECKGGPPWAFNNKTFDMGRTITKLTAGPYHVCALLEGGTAKCFGGNGDGQLGIGSTTYNYASSSHVMKDSSTILQGITDINAGGSSTCLVVANSKPMCFGRNYYYQLGIANGGAFGGNNVFYPTAVGVTFSTPAGVDVVSVHVNVYNGYAVMSDDSVYSWGGTKDAFGDDTYGLGQGDAIISGKIGDTVGEQAVKVAFGEWGS